MVYLADADFEDNELDFLFKIQLILFLRWNLT